MECSLYRPESAVTKFMAFEFLEGRPAACSQSA